MQLHTKSKIAQFHHKHPGAVCHINAAPFDSIPLTRANLATSWQSSHIVMLLIRLRHHTHTYAEVDQRFPTYISQVTGKADNFPHTRRRRLHIHTNLSTFWSPFLHIKPSQCLVFSVCPAYYRLYPCFLCYFLISDHL
jgi:hypothetical protein